MSEVFNEKTANTKYRSPRGEVCRITTLYNDFSEIYKGLFDEIPKQWQIHKIFTGQRFDFFEIALLGNFLNITPKDLQKESIIEKPQYELFDKQIIKLHKEGLSYPQIANKMGLSLDTIKNAAYISKRKAKPRARTGGKPGRRPLDWDNFDREILPKVVETIDELKSSEKPQRITIGGVARLVGLKSKQINQLPLCKSEILKHCQSQEAFWAEKVVWAWKKLSSEGRTISVKQIRLLTNMSVEQIKHCLIALQSIDKEVFNEMLRLLN